MTTGFLTVLGSHRPLRSLRLARLVACLRVVAGCFKGVSWEGLCGRLRNEDILLSE